MDAVIWVEFPEDVNHTRAEEAVSVSNHLGAVECEYTWTENRIHLQPRNPWIPGYRNTLIIDGVFNLPDNREYRVNQIVPFHILTSNNVPILLGFQPDDEAIVTQTEPLVLRFSRSMDEASFQEALRIKPDSDVNYAWTPDSSMVTVSPDKEWKSLTRHSVTIPESITDKTGVPLAEEYIFNFRTINDTVPPLLQNSHPWSMKSSQFLTNLTLDDIDNNLGIYLQFDESIDWDTLESAWSIDPDMTFQTVILSSSSAAFIPEDRWTPEESYTITIDENCQDLSGNRLIEPITVEFTCAILRQEVTAISHSTADPVNDLTAGSPASSIPLSLETGPEASHGFSLTLSQPLSVERLPDFIGTITITAVFPSTISTPELAHASLITPLTLELHYKNFSPAISGTQVNHYYRMSQNANPDKTVNDAGSHVTENWTILYVLEASP